MLVGIRPIQTSCGSQAVSPVTTTIAPLLLVGSINVGAEPLAALAPSIQTVFFDV
jgi:hypothetical protein